MEGAVFPWDEASSEPTFFPGTRRRKYLTGCIFLSPFCEEMVVLSRCCFNLCVSTADFKALDNVN